MVLRQNKQIWTTALIVVMVLFGFRLFGYAGINDKIERYPVLFMVPLLVVSCWKQITRKTKDVYYKLIRLLLISWTLSMFMSWIFWNQSPYLSYTTTGYYMFFVIFFYFCKRKVTRSSIEKLVVIFGWLYVILWLYALYKAPEITFGLTEDTVDNTDRGILRINFVGRLSLVFAYFYYLNKCLMNKSKISIILASTLFVFIVLQVTRQLILWVAVVTVIFIFLRAKKLAVSLAILFAIFYTGMSNIQFSDDTIIGSMINISQLQAEGQLYEGEDPRVTEYKYFFSDYSKNIITDVFGNGVPNINTSYGKYKAQQEMKGIYLADVGYPSIYVFLGLIGLFVYVFLFIRGTFQKLPEELGYINMFMAFMIPANVAASWYMGADTQLALAICVYLIYIYRNNPKLIER